MRSQIKNEASFLVEGGKMKFYEFILELQKLNKNKVVFVKSGVFFNSIGRDAIILEKVLGLKRTCVTKGICKVGLPTNYVRENLSKIKEKLEKNNIGFVFYDEMKNGNLIFKDRKYGILIEGEGKVINEDRKCNNCLNCNNNVYLKKLNNGKKINENIKEYTFKKEDYILILEILKNVFNSFKEKLDKENNINENTNDKTIK